MVNKTVLLVLHEPARCYCWNGKLLRRGRIVTFPEMGIPAYGTGIVLIQRTVE